MPPFAIRSSVVRTISIGCPVASSAPSATRAMQELERAGGRELRRAAEAAEVRVELCGQAALGLLQFLRRGLLLGRAQARRRAQALDRCAARPLDLVTARVPRLGHALEHLAEARHAVARLGREVGAAVERHALGIEEHVQRPAAVTRHRLHRAHVDRVDVGALLAVHLHGDEVLVHHRGRLRVLEGLVLHHVAPVARRVADRHAAAACPPPSRAASASSPHGYQSTGLSLCWRR